MEFEVTQVNGHTNGWNVQAQIFTIVGEVKTPVNKFLTIQNLTKEEALKYEIGDKIPV